MTIVDLLYTGALLLLLTFNHLTIKRRSRELEFRAFVIGRLVDRLADMNYGVVIDRKDYSVLVYKLFEEGVVNEHANHIVT